MKKDGKLASAIKLVNEAIITETKRLNEISSREEQDPIMVEGETETGYPCQLMADPKNVAKIYLRYEYPTWNILNLDAPDEMWRELACEFGLKTVYMVDL